MPEIPGHVDSTKFPGKYPTQQPAQGNQGTEDGSDAARSAPRSMPCLDPAPGGGQMKDIPGLKPPRASDMV